MSRWSADSLRIALAPGEVAMRRSRGIPASRVLATDERNATSLLPLLDEALADPSWHGKKVEVVVSQHFVRLVLTPPPGKALSSAEEHALATGSLRAIYGDEAKHWHVEVISQPPQYGLVGAAMDAALVQQLDALLVRHGFRDIAIRPLASVAARHLPRNYAGWWALAEPGWLSLFGGSHQAWCHHAALPVDADWMTDLPMLIEREAGLSATTLPAAAWVLAVGSGTVSAPVSGRIRWQILPHDSEASGALALLDI